MKMIRSKLCLGVMMTAILGGCDTPENGARMTGVVERDRLELAAEASEPIIDVYVAEGDHVAAGDLLLRQDDTILSARVRQAESARDRSAARYQELVRGPRVERITAAQARLKGAEDRFSEAQAEFKRTQTLRDEGTVSQSQYDDALVQLNDSRATREEMNAQLDELLGGTTPEELAQATATLTEAEAAVIVAQTHAARLTVRAPTSGLVEALPYKKGERPAAGKTVAIMLADGQPFVRSYLPATMRTQIRVGAAADVVIDGIDNHLRGTVRFVSSEAAFTPFFALTKHDRSRLSYLTEIVLVDADALNLPAGLPVEVVLDTEQLGTAHTAQAPE